MNVFFGSRHKRPVNFCIIMDVTEVGWLSVSFCQTWGILAQCFEGGEFSRYVLSVDRTTLPIGLLKCCKFVDEQDVDED